MPSVACCTLRATASCVAASRHTPLGWPVVPEVKVIFTVPGGSAAA